MLRVSAFLAIVFASATLQASSGLVGFRFTGILLPEADVFGRTLDAVVPVTGHVVYSSNAASNVLLADCDDCAAYAMDLVNAFVIEAGPVTLRYDSYAAAVINDGSTIFPGEVADFLTFRQNDTGPVSYTRQLLVDGVPVPGAWMDLALIADELLLQLPSLPTDPQPSDFQLSTLLVFDGVTFHTGLIHLDTLERATIPEGDYFVDGSLTWEDYGVWQTDFGATLASSADGNRDGVVDAADYTIWRDQMGRSSAGVPEPSSVAIVLALPPILLVTRSHRDGRKSHLM